MSYVRVGSYVKLSNSSREPLDRPLRNRGFSIGGLHIALVLQLAFSTIYRQTFGGSIITFLAFGLLALADAKIFINGARGRYFRGLKWAPSVYLVSAGSALTLAVRIFVPQQPNPLHFTVWYVPLLLIFSSDIWTAPLFLRQIHRPSERTHEA